MAGQNREEIIEDEEDHLSGHGDGQTTHLNIAVMQTDLSLGRRGQRTSLSHGVVGFLLIANVENE